MTTKLHRALIAGLLAATTLLLACGDSPTGPRPSAPPDPVGAPPAGDQQTPTAGVASFGILVAVDGQTLYLRQGGFEFTPTQGTQDPSVSAVTSTGEKGQELAVITDNGTQFYRNGSQVALTAFAVGEPIIVTGEVSGNGFHAAKVSDFRGTGTPSTLRSLDPVRSPVEAPKYLASILAQDPPVSLCVGSTMEYGNDPEIGLFQGCFGGPSSRGTIPFLLPVFCPLIGCMYFANITYQVNLAGWSYAFPIRFRTTAATQVVYHQPSTVNLEIASVPPKPASALTYLGGLGFRLEMPLVWCYFPANPNNPEEYQGPNQKCYDIVTVPIAVLSMEHQSRGAAPLSGPSLDIETVSCPTIGSLSMFGVPTAVDPFAVQICEMLTIDASPFYSQVRATSVPTASFRERYFQSSESNKSLTFVPEGPTVDIRYSRFTWVPTMNVGLRFRFQSISYVWDSTRTIPLGTGGWPAITPTFPEAGFSVPTDPASITWDPSTLKYLFQPTEIRKTLQVAPAPTALTFVSSTTLAEGSTVRARLVESYDGRAVAGQTIQFSMSGTGETVSTCVGLTDASGVAVWTCPMPVGKYNDVVAQFQGTNVLIASSDAAQTVYVYRPTQYIVWGGNLGGIKIGKRYQFWGNGWWNQVTGGSFSGRWSNFFGAATSMTSSGWESEFATSVNGLKALPRYIGVMVATSIEGGFLATKGNIAGWAILKPEALPAYQPPSGLPAWGSLVATVNP